MVLAFTKMHGLGNDFIVLEDLDNTLAPGQDLVRRLADRRTGIGFDQLLLIQASNRDDADCRYRVFNADGSEVEQCGNGIRCVARYLKDRGIVAGDAMVAETGNGLLHTWLLEDGRVRVNMGQPRFDPVSIPVSVETLQNPVAIDTAGGVIQAVLLSMGNPHAVISVPDVDSMDVQGTGAVVQQHELFPDSVNVGFMQVMKPDSIRLRVYERGAGETLACGSGACAAVVAGILHNGLEQDVNVTLQGGDLQVSWPGDGEPVWMTGPAETVYTGQIEI